MKLNFDYYHNLERVELRLCNPDGRELFPLQGRNRNLILRFNDLSELTFEVDSKTTLSDGTTVNLEVYEYIQTKRLVFATNIGWFQISDVNEYDNGIVKYKKVTAESYQAVLKNKGFLSEERVYCFYNPSDPNDSRYDYSKDDAVPSVVGQLNKQLGIEQDLLQGRSEPENPYDNWTITYIHSSLIYDGSGGTCRTFKENTTFGYDWIVNDVEDAFKVVAIFDFMYKTIQFLIPSEITEKADVIYTFNNFMKSVDINESSKDIVTVLNCNGDNCDITMVNPTGTNYICDFSYYMDKIKNRWMSSNLIAKLEEWRDLCDKEKDGYSDCVLELRNAWKEKTEYTAILQEISLLLQDLKNAQNKRSVIGDGETGALCGVVTAETVEVNEKSLETKSDYSNVSFDGGSYVTAYQNPPDYDTESRKWIFSTDNPSKHASADSIIQENLSDNNASPTTYWYFSDVTDESSYCKLKSEVSVDEENNTSTYYCNGFDRYIAYSYPETEENGKIIKYSDTLQEWINIYESKVNTLNKEVYGYVYETESPKPGSIYGRIKELSQNLDEISSKLNIISYFRDDSDLLQELNCYWIEGDYNNENIAVLESTTPEEEIDLANELLRTGEIELAKVCQPHLSFSLESVDATKNYEFREQMSQLELGKIITIEKEEGLWYYPALLEISMNLDDSKEFSLKFANATKLDDWGYTYADLISNASSTSRKVNANWQNLLAYSKDKETITSVIKDPLDSTLRASLVNMVNQDFVVDKNGILGRKRKTENSEEFENEQVRLINNLLIFTDDNWKTAKTALGKVYYKDENGNDVSSYGLVAETIIGELLLGNTLYIKNNDESVLIDNDGITIKNNDNKTFKVDTAGNITLSGNITWSTRSNPLKVLYRTNPVKVLYRRDHTDEKPNEDYTSYPESDNSGWHTEPNIGYDGYVSFNTKEGSADGWSEVLSYYNYDIDSILTFEAPEYSYSSYDSYSDYLWHQTFDGGNDFYASYSYDGGTTWGEPVRIVGSNGKDGTPAKKLTATEIAELLSGLDHGLSWVNMYDEGTGELIPKLCIKGDYIMATDSIHLGMDRNSDAGAACITGYNGNTKTIDAADTYNEQYHGYYGFNTVGFYQKSITNGICMTKIAPGGDLTDTKDGEQQAIVAVSDGGAKLAWTKAFAGSAIGDNHDYSEFYVAKDLATVYVTAGGNVGINYEGTFTINGGEVTFELIE